MKYLFFLFLLLGLSEGAQIGSLRSITITIDFGGVPASPASTIVWAPPDHGHWSISFLDWVRGGGTIANATAGTLTNATDRGRPTDPYYFALGDGTNLEAILTGPFWGDSGVPYALDPGEQVFLSGSSAMMWVNELRYYSPPTIADRTGVGLDVLQRVLLQGSYTTDASLLWGFDVVLDQTPTTPSMTPDITVPYLLYSQSKPLVVQHFTSPDTPPLPLDGSITFRAIATRRS